MTENYTAQNEASEFVAIRTYDAVRALCDIIGIRYAIDTNTSLVLLPTPHSWPRWSPVQ